MTANQLFQFYSNIGTTATLTDVSGLYQAENVWRCFSDEHMIQHFKGSCEQHVCIVQQLPVLLTRS